MKLNAKFRLSTVICVCSLHFRIGPSSSGIIYLVSSFSGRGRNQLPGPHSSRDIKP